MLELTYTPDEIVGTGAIRALVDTGDVRATREFCSDEAAIREFARALRAFPIVRGKEPRLAAGYVDNDGTLRPVIDVSVAPFNARGDLVAIVELKMEPLRSTEETVSQKVRVAFITEYPSVDRFASSLLGLIEDPTSTATLLSKP